MLVLVVGALALSGCGNARGVADTRRALERSGYREVEVTVRSGGGVDVARVDASGSDPAPAAEVVWATLPVRFDQLVVALGSVATPYSYEALAQRFGPRDPDLDRRQVTDEVVREGLGLMVWLTLAALVSVGGVVALGFLVVRAARRARPPAGGDQTEGPTSGLAAESPTAGEPAAADGPESIPS